MDDTALAGVTAQQRRSLREAATLRPFDRRQVIFSAGDEGGTLFLVRSGHVAIRIVTEDGDTATLTVVGPDQTFGELALLSGEQRRSATAVALETTEAWVLSAAQLQHAKRSGLPVEAFLLQLVADEVHRLTRQLIEALYVPVRHRVVRTLLELCPQYREPGESLNLLITQDDVAGLTGAARPTVNQVLQNLEAAGAIRLHRGRIEVIDQAELRRRRG